jgi:hypothetical protein
MRSSAAVVLKPAANVVHIDRGRKINKHVQQFMEDMRLRPRKALKGESNASQIRTLTVAAIRHSKQGSLAFEEIRAAISYSLTFELKWEYLQSAILSDMKDSRLAIMGGRVFVL